MHKTQAPRHQSPATPPRPISLLVQLTAWLLDLFSVAVLIGSSGLFAVVLSFQISGTLSHYTLITAVLALVVGSLLWGLGRSEGMNKDMAHNDTDSRICLLTWLSVAVQIGMMTPACLYCIENGTATQLGLALALNLYATGWVYGFVRHRIPVSTGGRNLS